MLSRVPRHQKAVMCLTEITRVPSASFGQHVQNHVAVGRELNVNESAIDRQSGAFKQKRTHNKARY